MENSGIEFSLFKKVIGLMSIVIALSVSKIYVSNQIYYRSKEINKVGDRGSALKEENSILSMNVEKASL